MVNIKEIITMCKNGQLDAALDAAKAELEKSPQDVWAQRAMGWALYYAVREEIAQQRKDDALSYAELLLKLNMLDGEQDSMIFDSLLWKLCELLKQAQKDDFAFADRVFGLLSVRQLNASQAYSVLLKNFLAFKGWPKMMQCLEWWNLDKLQPEDYKPFKLENGRSVMALAEQAYIAYAKGLLQSGDKERIRAFVPKMEKLMDGCPEMTYPGYFCGKLLMATGAGRDEALKAVMPFVHKKQTEFWVWQLLSEIYKEDITLQLACLLRAVHCKTQETFLGKVRMKLANLYCMQGDYNRARYQTDAVGVCCQRQGWHVPYDVQDLMRRPEMQQAVADGTPSVDYKGITNRILMSDAERHIAAVTYVDAEAKRAHLIYGYHKHLAVPIRKLGMPVQTGMLIWLYLLPERDGNPKVAGTDKGVTERDLDGVGYIKTFSGAVTRKEGADFGFLNEGKTSCYIGKQLVRQYNLSNGSVAGVVAALVYNKQKDLWNWAAIRVTNQ